MTKFFNPLMFVLLLLQCACSKSVEERTKEIMGELYKKNIKIPADLVLLNPEAVDREYKISLQKESNTNYYVVHYFEADCEKCINELRKAQDFILKTKDMLPETKFIFIADSPTEIFAKKAIEDLKFQFPVFYEKDYAKYKKINSFPIGNSTYNTALLNEKHQLLLLGSLFNNEKAESLYKDIITQNRADHR